MTGPRKPLKPKPAPKKPGRPRFRPTQAERKQVSQMAAAGITHAQIAQCVRDGIAKSTLELHFRDELTTALAKANATVAGKLYNTAMEGNVTAMIFWLKTRAKWEEKAQQHEHTGKVKIELVKL